MSTDPIYAITQFTGGTGVVWRGLTQPVPNGVLTVESDTGIVKRGDGVTPYAELPVFFNAHYLQDVAASVEEARAQAVIAQENAAIAVAAANRSQAGSKVSAITTDANPTEMSGLGALPDGVSSQQVSGFITAQDTTTGYIVSWSIHAMAVRPGVGAEPILKNGFIATTGDDDPSMSACTLTYSTNSLGLVLTATGLPTTTIVWSGTLTVTSTP